MKGMIWRAPFQLFAAFGLLSLSSSVIDIAVHIQNWLVIWEVTVRPIMSFALHPIHLILGLNIPEIIKDYFAIGIINVGMFFRMETKSPEFLEFDISIGTSIFFLILNLTLWPVMFFFNIFKNGNDLRIYKHALEQKIEVNNAKEIKLWKRIVEESEVRTKIYLETLVWFFILICINYALFFLT